MQSLASKAISGEKYWVATVSKAWAEMWREIRAVGRCRHLGVANTFGVNPPRNPFNFL